MSDEQDLTEALATAAADAVRARKPAIEAGRPRNLRGVMVEIEVSNNGQVLDVVTHVSWRDVVRNASKGG